MKTVAVVMILLVSVAYLGLRIIVPDELAKRLNQVNSASLGSLSKEAQQLHNNLFIADWHADSTLWDRDLAELSHIGHVDLPRLQQGKVALQVFTTVTKSPRGLNYQQNQADAADDITSLALVQGWPISTWTSLTARALHQASKIHNLVKARPDEIMLITSQQSLQQFLARRKQQPDLLGAMLGTEGSHALDGELSNIDVLFDNGFRMMSLQHFFDNKLGGSLHGSSGAGLTDFGRQAVVRMQSLGTIVDVSHSSEQTVRDVLAINQAPLVVSHTGFKGHCDSPRNIEDALMKQIAEKGGLIAVGYWQEAACGISPQEIADAIVYGISLVGEDHIALGSDFDGSVTTAMDTSQLAHLTQALLQKGLSVSQIEKVMGANSLRFLQLQLPQ